MRATEILLVRHGESTSNLAGRWQGQGDGPLSPLGRAQAAALGAALDGLDLTAVISSDLQRAADTARALGRPVRVDARWRELDVGRWEGLTADEVAAAFPNDLDALQGDPDARMGGGESWTELTDRSHAAFGTVAGALAPGDRVAVVCHGGVILALLERLLGLDRLHPRRLGRLRNTACSLVRLVDGRVTLRTYNETAHLGADSPAHPRPGTPHHVVRVSADQDRDRGAEEARRACAAIGARGGELGVLQGARAGHLLVSDLGTTLLDWNVTVSDPAAGS